MRNFSDEHLVGFESLPDWEEATPGCFEEEYTDIFGTELIHRSIGDGSEAYDHDIDRRQYRRIPKKVSSKHSC